MNTVILTIGAPGSGKSTWGLKFANDNGYVYLSSDKNRATLGTGENDQTVSAAAFRLLEDQLTQALASGNNVLVDATFMSRKARKKFVSISRDAGAKLEAMVFELPKSVIMERNKKRAALGGRDVPEFVIDKMLGNYQRPESPEFDKIKFI